MRRAIAIQEELDQIHVVEDLTGVFESVASIKIARLRNRVVASKEFFAELWQTYASLRVDPREQLLRKSRKTNGKSVLVAVTTEGKLSGEIGNKVIQDAEVAYRQAEGKIDMVVLGSYGALQLKERGVTVTQTFALPKDDTQISVTDIITLLGEYEQISVFYQTYESLRVQKVGRIELLSAVHELTEQVDETKDVKNEQQKTEKTEIVSSHEYIFEPDITEVANYLESMMMGVALTQVLMESKLAQFASRFNAMNAAKHRAHDLAGEYSLMFYRAKRAEGDERLKEIMKVVSAQRGAA